MPDTRVITLNDRDLRILAGIAEGRTNTAIARSIGLTPGGTANVRTELFRRLGALNGAHAVHIAHQLQLLTPADA